MNLDENLRSIQDLRAQLALWGITNHWLLIAGGVGLILFFFSLREVLSWYLRMQQVRDEVRELRAQMQVMQNTLNETRDFF